MGKYREKVIAGSEWVQLGRAKVHFFTNQPTKILFEEEKAVQIDENVKLECIREIEVTLTDPTTKFILVNPNDNKPIGGDMTYRQLERAIYSLYYAKAQELDALVIQPNP